MVQVAARDILPVLLYSPPCHSCYPSFPVQDHLRVLPWASLAGPEVLTFADFPVEMLQALWINRRIQSPDLGNTILAAWISQVCCLCIIFSARMQCHKWMKSPNEGSWPHPGAPVSLLQRCMLYRWWPAPSYFSFRCSLPLLHTHTLLRNARSKFQAQQMHQFNLYRAENLLVLKLLCISIAVCGQVEKEPWSLPPIKRDKTSCWYAKVQLRTDQLGYVTA